MLFLHLLGILITTLGLLRVTYLDLDLVPTNTLAGSAFPSIGTTTEPCILVDGTCRLGSELFFVLVLPPSASARPPWPPRQATNYPAPAPGPRSEGYVMRRHQQVSVVDEQWPLHHAMTSLPPPDLPLEQSPPILGHFIIRERWLYSNVESMHQMARGEDDEGDGLPRLSANGDQLSPHAAALLLIDAPSPTLDPPVVSQITLPAPALVSSHARSDLLSGSTIGREREISAATLARLLQLGTSQHTSEQFVHVIGFLVLAIVAGLVAIGSQYVLRGRVKEVQQQAAEEGPVVAEKDIDDEASMVERAGDGGDGPQVSSNHIPPRRASQQQRRRQITGFVFADDPRATPTTDGLLGPIALAVLGSASIPAAEVARPNTSYAGLEGDEDRPDRDSDDNDLLVLDDNSGLPESADAGLPGRTAGWTTQNRPHIPRLVYDDVPADDLAIDEPSIAPPPTPTPVRSNHLAGPPLVMHDPSRKKGKGRAEVEDEEAEEERQRVCQALRIETRREELAELLARTATPNSGPSSTSVSPTSEAAIGLDVPTTETEASSARVSPTSNRRWTPTSLPAAALVLAPVVLSSDRVASPVRADVSLIAVTLRATVQGGQQRVIGEACKDESKTVAAEGVLDDEQAVMILDQEDVAAFGVRAATAAPEMGEDEDAGQAILRRGTWLRPASAQDLRANGSHRLLSPSRLFVPQRVPEHFLAYQFRQHRIVPGRTPVAKQREKDDKTEPEV
ncbi:VASt domain-containing protein [Mycena chlorophos]|uniref:VASt domain-containing protein n=1 Tax=Mycena chlorophos TaxID=658473 RepID=A0A8H6TI88_MYCCL|nr:VASt domain-containing protein [Mycena chlorophos]